MATASTLSKYTNEVALKVPNEAILGNLVWFSVNHADVPLEQARVDLEGLGLSTATLRKRLRPIDAFKKASNSVAKGGIINADGTESNFLVRQVGQDSDTSHRHVVLERVVVKSGKRRRLSFDKVAELVYTRGSWDKKANEVIGDALDVNITIGAGLELSKEEADWLNENISAVPERFEHWKVHLDTHAVRTFVREYLYALSGVCVRESGGVYFVRQSHADTIAKLGEWVRSIGSDLHALPLLDLVDQRQMLLKAFEEETIAEVERLSAELSKILSNPDRTITEDTFAQYRDKASELLAKADEYQSMLGMKVERSNLELSLFKQQTLQLASRVKVPKSKR